jgi:putative pyruvate formate lyase activating enzyme
VGARGRDFLALPEALEVCGLCPRRCGANRAAGERGVCGADGGLQVGRAALHYWEEPPLSGERGSGAVFFSHCSLRCRFCQNGQISAGGFGVETDVEGLASSMLDLQAQGAHNVNLVTATHYAPQVRVAVALARARGLDVPVVYNTSGYELPEAIDALEGTVDVWLPDFKYADAALARRLSQAADYPQVALAAVARMVEQVRRAGGRLVDGEGIMRRGVIVRHLVLPGHVQNSLDALDVLWGCFGNDVDLSVMNQYTPQGAGPWLDEDPDLARPVTHEEYEEVLDRADDLGFENLWWQQGGAVGESFIPVFDGTGVAGVRL